MKAKIYISDERILLENLLSRESLVRDEDWEHSQRLNRFGTLVIFFMLFNFVSLFFKHLWCNNLIINFNFCDITSKDLIVFTYMTLFLKIHCMCQFLWHHRHSKCHFWCEHDCLSHSRPSDGSGQCPCQRQRDLVLSRYQSFN